MKQTIKLKRITTAEFEAFFQLDSPGYYIAKKAVEHDDLEDIERACHFSGRDGLLRDVVPRRIELEEGVELVEGDELELQSLFHSSISKSCEARTGSLVRRRQATVTRLTNLSEGLAVGS